MATINNTSYSLIDVVARTAPDGSMTRRIAELLNQENPMVGDFVWQEGNKTEGHEYQVRTEIPTPTWVGHAQGVASTKTRIATHEEKTGMLMQRSSMPKSIAVLNGNSAAFRADNMNSAIEGMNQEFARALIYGSRATNDKEIDGLATRYSSLTTGAQKANIINAGGSGSDNCSIYLVGHGLGKVYGIYPKGTPGGIQHLAIQDGTGDGCIDVLDADSLRYRAMEDELTWKCGVVVEDWRYIVRVANIDFSTTVASTGRELLRYMNHALGTLPGTGSVKPVFYMNRSLALQLMDQAANASSAAVGWQQAVNTFGKSVLEMHFMGYPIRISDKLLLTEAAIT